MVDPFVLPFPWNSAALTPGAETLVGNAASVFGPSGGARIRVAGHADRSGSAAYNLALSRRRAEAVRAALIDRGIAAELVTVEAYGETRPLIETGDGVREPRNSRVEIVIEPRTS